MKKGKEKDTLPGGIKLQYHATVHGQINNTCSILPGRLRQDYRARYTTSTHSYTQTL